MATSIKEIFWARKKGLNIPSTLLEELGVSEGTSMKVEIEDSLIKIYPETLTKNAIEKKAILYSLENLGDAVGIGDVKFLKKEKIWEVPIKIFTGDVVGDIYFTAGGHFIPEKSDTEEDMLKRAEEMLSITVTHDGGNLVDAGISNKN
jgi:antitoxin component of MazEF toxin-antitoxin module